MQVDATRLSGHSHLLFLCGHYEGVDHRVIEELVDEEISIGDYVLTNGAIAAAVISPGPAYSWIVNAFSGFQTQLIDAATASAVMSVPSWNFTPWRSVNRRVLSSTRSQPVARIAGDLYCLEEGSQPDMPATC